MASNARTPRSVREAPRMERIFIHTTRGANRTQRRAAATKIPNAYQRRAQGWRFGESYPSDNEPYVNTALPAENNSRWRRWARKKHV